MTSFKIYDPSKLTHSLFQTIVTSSSSTPGQICDLESTKILKPEEKDESQEEKIIYDNFFGVQENEEEEMTQKQIEYEFCPAESNNNNSQGMADAIQYGSMPSMNLLNRIDSNIRDDQEEAFVGDFDPSFFTAAEEDGDVDSGNAEGHVDSLVNIKTEDTEEEIERPSDYNALDCLAETDCSDMVMFAPQQVNSSDDYSDIEESFEVTEVSLGYPKMTFKIQMRTEMFTKMSNFRIIWPKNTFRPKEDMSKPVDGNTTIYCNTVKAKRPTQRRTLFGFEIDDESASFATPDEYSMGIYLSMPGVHSTIRRCSKHAAEDHETEFFKVYVKDVEITDKMNHPEKENQEMFVFKLPLDKNHDDSALHFVFFCVTSCLSKAGDAKNRLKMNFCLINKDLQVIHEVSQPIRITANPQRDAGIFNTRSEQSKPAQIKRSRPGPSSTGSDDDWTPNHHPVKKIKSEPSVPVRQRSQTKRSCPNELFESITNTIPDGPDKDKIRANLLRMNSQDRNLVLKQEQKRLRQNLLLATQQSTD